MADETQQTPQTTPKPTLTLEEIEAGAKQINAQVPIPEPVPEPAKFVRTYEDDMARSMNVSDAKVVQELLYNARERETIEEIETHNRKAKGWYVVGSIVLLLVALAAVGYGIYHYTRLTVPVTENVSVGVFASTEPIVASGTTLDSVLATFPTETLTENKPYLLSLVTDSASQTLLSNSALFSFIGATPTEPFLTALSAVRIGVMNTGGVTAPFIIMSVPDMDVALKEFLLAEPVMLAMFAKTFTIDTSTLETETAPAFMGEYRYNVPVRTLYTMDTSGVKNQTLQYASLTNNIIIITKDTAVLKSVYDTILRQN